MWEVMLDVVPDVAGLLWPGRKLRTAERSDPDTLVVQFGVPGAFTRGLNERSWLPDAVLAAGVLRQGKPPSVMTAITGLAIIELARRRSKLLPREFVLAVTADRVVAFAMTTESNDTSTPTIKVRRDELGCWPRRLVRLVDPTKGLLTWGATLKIARERIAVVADDDDSTNELVELLSPCASAARPVVATVVGAGLGSIATHGHVAPPPRSILGGVEVDEDAPLVPTTANP
jgi:hypothetical protein